MSVLERPPCGSCGNPTSLLEMAPGYSPSDIQGVLGSRRPTVSRPYVVRCTGCQFRVQAETLEEAGRLWCFESRGTEDYFEDCETCGSEKSILVFPFPKECPSCHGAGEMDGGSFLDCPTCEGAGTLDRSLCLKCSESSLDKMLEADFG